MNNNLDAEFVKNLLIEYYNRYDNGYYEYEEFISNAVDSIFYDIFGHYIYEENK